MHISVVIPVYNRQQIVLRALHSVYAQTSPANEVIVVDDGSTDRTCEKIKQQYPQVRLIQQHNKGVSTARNTGILAARYEWIALLDSDDEWLPEKLEIIRQYGHQNPQEVLFHTDEIWIRNGTRVNPMNKHQKQGGMIFQQCLSLCVISPSAAVIHRALFDQVGLFNESLPACEDYDLWLRLCHRFPVFFIDQMLINKYGGHADQLSRKYWGMDRFRIRALMQLLQLPTLNDEQRFQCINMLQHKLNILIKGARKHNNQAVLNEFEPVLKQYEPVPC